MAGRRRKRPYFSWKDCGHRLRVTRIVLGLTEAEAAAAHGVTIRTYRAWEAGGRQRGGKFKVFADAYDVSIDWLVRGVGYTLHHHLAINKGGKVAILPVSDPCSREFAATLGPRLMPDQPA